MTLDDFFTLTEMNNGLTAPSRVMELVAVMQKEKDCAGKDVGDSTRQWSAVAGAISATESKDCLDLFLQLDGLHFLDKWLKDAQKFSNETNDSVVEQSVIHLIQALEKLHVDYEKLIASGIWRTVENLLVHNSSRVKDKARELFASWKKKADGNASISDVEKIGVLTDVGAEKIADIEEGNGRPESSTDASISRDTSVQEKGQESTRDDPVLSASCDDSHPSQAETAISMTEILEPSVRDNRPLDYANSTSSANLVEEPPVSHSVGSTLVESCSPAGSKQEKIDGPTDFDQMQSSSSDIKYTPKNESSPDKVQSLEEYKTLEGRPFTSCSDDTDAKESVAKPSMQRTSTATEKHSLYINSRETDSRGKIDINDGGHSSQFRSLSSFSVKEGGDFKHHILSAGSEKSLANPKGLETFRPLTEDDVKINKRDLHKCNGILANNYDFSKKEMDRGRDQAGKKSDVELDYGIVDPIDIALQVALEVGKQVVDYGEQSCSSSEKLRVSNGQSDSTESVSGKKSHASEGSQKEVASDQEASTEDSPMQEDSATSTETLDGAQTNGTLDMEASQVTEAAQEEANAEKGICNFDLNEEFCSEEDENPGNQFLAPVSVVSASRAAAALGLPDAPLQFEGNLGWKGSAATSAFRPASPRRVLETDKDLSTWASSSSSKQRQEFLEIDLNVAESVDGRTGDLWPDNNVPLFSTLPSGESSVETNSRRSELLGLDLNRESEDGGVPLDCRIRQFLPQGNGHHSRSHSSSSSSKQAYARNIDLNDQPSFLNNFSDHSHLSNLSQNLNITGGIKSHDSVISLLGARVEVKHKDLVSHTLPLPNGRTPELAFDVNMGRSGNFLGVGSVIPYTNSPVYGYNNFAPGPSMPFSSTVYGPGGPIPYMVDSRGAPVFPQLMGSASALPTAYSQPPFLMNMTSSIPSNGIGSSRSTFDLNPGTMAETVSRDPAGFGQFLNLGPIRPVDEQMRSNAQLSVGSVGGKRKEPENGWEHYPYRNYTSQWK